MTIYGNDWPGIFWEISDHGTITGNKVWNNGFKGGSTEDGGWGYGAGILISSSEYNDISGNIVAWNADQITVVSQTRNNNTIEYKTPDVENYVHNNTLFGIDPVTGQTHVYALGWLQDWAGVLFDPGSNNRGANNQYWYASPEGKNRFAWSGGYSSLTNFNSTPGEEGGQYLSNALKDQILTTNCIPLSPGGVIPCTNTPTPTIIITASVSPTIPPIIGDANGDGKVDGVDYIVWLNHYNQTTVNGYRDGDFNGDGIIDGIDYIAWLNNYGK